jgi:hypothetical protein
MTRCIGLAFSGWERVSRIGQDENRLEDGTMLKI